MAPLRTRLAEVEATAEGMRQRVLENETLRAKLADLEASAQHAWQWQEAYTQLQRQLHDVQVLLAPVSRSQHLLAMVTLHECWADQHGKHLRSTPGSGRRPTPSCSASCTTCRCSLPHCQVASICWQQSPCMPAGLPSNGSPA